MTTTDPTWLERRDANIGLLAALRAVTGSSGDGVAARDFVLGYLLADIDPDRMREAVEAAIREHDRHVTAVTA